MLVHKHKKREKPEIQGWHTQMRVHTCHKSFRSKCMHCQSHWWVQSWYIPKTAAVLPRLYIYIYIIIVYKHEPIQKPISENKIKTPQNTSHIQAKRWV